MNMDDLLRNAEWASSLALRLVNDQSRADDLVQDAFQAALADREGKIKSPRAFFATVMRRTAVHIRQRESQRIDIEKEAFRRGQDRARDADMKIEALRLILTPLEELPDVFRVPLVLHYFEGLTIKEIGRRLGISRSGVRTRLQRSRDELRKELDRRHNSDSISWGIALIPLALSPSAGMIGATSQTSAFAKGVVAVTANTKVMIAAVLVVVGLTTYISGQPEEEAVLSGTGHESRRTDINRHSERPRDPVLKKSESEEGTRSKPIENQPGPESNAEPLSRITVTVTGVLVDSAGRQVEDGLVRLFERKAGALIIGSRTGADGRFFFKHASSADPMILECSRNGIGQVRLAITLESDRDLGEILLEGEGTLMGVVRDSHGNPLPNMAFSVFPKRLLGKKIVLPIHRMLRPHQDLSAKAGLESTSIESDAQGRFKVKGLRPGQYFFVPSDEGVIFEDGDLTYHTSTEPIALVVRSWRLLVQAINQNGEPMEKVSFKLLHFSPEADLRTVHHDAATYTENAGDDDNEAIFYMPPKEGCIIAASKGGAYAEKIVWPESGVTERRVKLVLNPTPNNAKLRAILKTAAGKVPELLSVSIQGQRTRIELEPWSRMVPDKDGRMSGLPVGTHLLAFRYKTSPQGESRVVRRKVELFSDLETTIEILVSEPSALSILITASESANLSGCYLEIRRTSGSVQRIFKFEIPGQSDRTSVLVGTTLFVPGGVTPGPCDFVLARGKTVLARTEATLEPGSPRLIKFDL